MRFQVASFPLELSVLLGSAILNTHVGPAWERQWLVFINLLVRVQGNMAPGTAHIDGHGFFSPPAVFAMRFLMRDIDTGFMLRHSAQPAVC